MISSSVDVETGYHPLSSCCFIPPFVFHPNWISSRGFSLLIFILSLDLETLEHALFLELHGQHLVITCEGPAIECVGRDRGSTVGMTDGN
jgi:hypothetical protein